MKKLLEAIVVAVVVAIFVVMLAGSAEAAVEIDHRLFSVDVADAERLAVVMYNEANGLPTAEVAMVAWCVLNRVDSPDFPNTIADVIYEDGQFKATGDGGEYCWYWLAEDVLQRYAAEKMGFGNIGRVLPESFVYFYGDGDHNYFYDPEEQIPAYGFVKYPSPYVLTLP